MNTVESIFGADSMRAFNEAEYLALYPDVAAVVALGGMPSGAHHFIHHGWAERRIGPGFEPFAARFRDPAAFAAKSSGVTVVGPFSEPTGLGRSTRAYLRAAIEAGFTTDAVNSTPYAIDRGGLGGSIEETPEIARIREKQVTIWVSNGDAFPESFRRISPEVLNDSWNVGVWVWELASAPANWELGVGGLDELWVPSEFVRQAVQQVSTVPVHLVPYVVEIDESLIVLKRGDFGIPEEAYAFLFMFDSASYLERKNPHLVVEAFRSAFGDDPKTVLVLKTLKAKEDSDELKALRVLASASNVLFFEDDFNDSQNYSLKSICDCFVSPHASEGFGLNVAEAMLLGRPVISTDYSSTSEFVNDSNGYPLRYELSSVGRDMGPYGSGAVWAKPNGEHLAELLRHVYDHQDEANGRGAVARETIRTRFSARAIGELLRERINAGTSQAEQVNLDPQTMNLSNTIRLPQFLRDGVGVDLRDLRPDAASRVSVIMPVYNVQGDILRASVDSVRAQTYANWELCICDDASTLPETIRELALIEGSDPRIRVVRLPENSGISVASNRAVEISTGEFIALLDNDDEYDPQALEHFVRRALLDHDSDFWYSDEDKIDFDGNYVDPYFKPDWSPEHLESCMYVLHLLMIRKSVFLRLGGFRKEFSGAQDYDIALRLSLNGSRAGHIPHVLYHWRMVAGSASAEIDAKPLALANAQQALEDYAVKKYGAGSVADPGLLPGLFRVRPPRDAGLEVTLVILTNDSSGVVPGRGRVRFLSNLLDSIRARTDFPDFRLLVVDNGNLNAQRRSELGLSDSEILTYEGSQHRFNFSDKANFAVSNVETEYLVLLNDDMEVLEPGWLTALMELVIRPAVGAVGCRLLNSDGTIQHVGVVGGVFGATAHMYHGAPKGTIGYNGFPNLIRNYSMVTGACLAVKRSTWEAVGGFDRAFAIDFNDVDFCLRLIARGLRVVYTPFAELIHFEGKTIVRSKASDHERTQFIRRWEHTRFLSDDPYFNSNLSKFHLDFRPSLGTWG